MSLAAQSNMLEVPLMKVRAAFPPVCRLSHLCPALQLQGCGNDPEAADSLPAPPCAVPAPEALRGRGSGRQQGAGERCLWGLCTSWSHTIASEKA